MTSSGRSGVTEAPGASTSDIKPVISTLSSVLSGSISGMVSGILLQPLDVLRTKAQTLAIDGRSATLREAVVAIARGDKGLRGVLHFWAGTQPTVLRLGIGSGFHFVVLETLKPVLQRRQVAAGGDPDRLGGMFALAAGALSRGSTTALMTPVTVVKTRMEAGNAQGYANTFHALSCIVKQEGVRGLFRGLVPTVLTNAPYSGLYFMIYSEAKAALGQRLGEGIATNLVSSLIGSVGATLATQPMDVVRTFVQLQSAEAAKASGKSVTAAAVRKLSSKGVSVLMAGLGPRFVKRSLQTALIWTLYEELAPRLTSTIRITRPVAVVA